MPLLARALFNRRIRPSWCRPAGAGPQITTQILFFGLADNQMIEHAVDPILLEVFWSRLTAIVTEQAARTVRASFSPLVREAGDLATAIFDAKGQLIVHGVTG